MTIRLSEKFTDIRDQFIASIKGGADVETQGKLYADMLDVLREDVVAEARLASEAAIAVNPLDGKLSARERKFFNEINKEVGYKEEKLLPQETIDRIFEDLETEHPLLTAIGVVNSGMRRKILKSTTSGQAVWGKIYGEIKGQLDAAFSEEENIDSKLTAFVVIPKDLQDLGVGWIERFVRMQIDEVFAAALEAAFLGGDGNDKPIGLTRQVQKGVSVSGGVYPEKTPSGTLTFADAKTTVKELTEVFKLHSVKEDGKTPVVTDGKVAMIVNPKDAWEVKAQYTTLNAMGVYVTAMPFNVEIMESVAQTAGKVTTFVKGRYYATVGGGITIRKYQETLALEDMDLYAAKTFAYGKADDNTAAAVWTLTIAGGVVAPVPPGSATVTTTEDTAMVEVN